MVKISKQKTIKNKSKSTSNNNLTRKKKKNLSSKNAICDEGTNLNDCELKILRNAIDKAEIIKGKYRLKNTTIRNIIHIVEQFIRNKKRICYGGTAINSILPEEDKFYNKNKKNLKINSEKMTSELQNRQNKIKNDIDDNQQIPEKLAQSKGQNLQNLENLNKENQELEEQISAGETKLNEIKKNLNEVQEKYSLLRENRARLEATIEGIEKRKSDLVFNLKNDLRIEDTKNLINHTDLAMEQLPSISEQEEKLENINKQREALGSVNLRADEETKNIQGEIEKMEKGDFPFYLVTVSVDRIEFANKIDS